MGGAMVSISHEIPFEAWPSLKELMETHNKAVMNRTLVESRVQKLASGVSLGSAVWTRSGDTTIFSR
jgi:hypothetical protein